jgi:hypothetical protein
MRSLAAAISPGDVGFADWACAAEAPSEIAAKVPIATRKNHVLIIIFPLYSFIFADALNPFGSSANLVPINALECSSERTLSSLTFPRACGNARLAVGTRLRRQGGP